MEFESPDVEKEFPGLYASESSRRSNESDFSDDAHERPSKKDLLIGKRKDKKDSKKDRGYAALGGESSPEEESEMKSPSKSKKTKSFKFPSSSKKEKREKSREKDGKEKEREADKEKKKEKEAKTKLKIKERKKSKHGDDVVEIGDEQPVFGVPLQLAVARSRCHDGVDIPLVVRDAIDYLQDHGVTMEGVFKVSGIKSKVHHLRRAYDRREPASLTDYEPPTVTSLFKLFFRELPEPCLTAKRLPRFEEAAASKEALAREAELRALVQQLPECNRQLLAWLMLHLENITLHEKQTKMNAQSIAIALSPALQMSHRLLSAFLCHAKSLFPDVTLHKYIPPLTGSSPAMPDTASGIVGELRKQESLLNQIHQEMNAGLVSKRKEEQLWEVQRIITQLKRKLRTFQRSLDTSQSQKSMDEDRKPSEDEFRMDLTLQKAHSCSEEDSAVAANKPITTRSEPSAVPTKPPSVGVDVPVIFTKPVVAPEHVHSVAPAAVAPSPPTTLPSATAISPLTPPPEEEDVQLDTPCDPTPTVSSLEDVACTAGGSPTADAGGRVAEELQGLLQEETLLQLEQRELLNLQADLQGRVQGERDEIEKLRCELEIARTKYNYRGFGCDSSDASSSPSLSDISDADDPEVETRMLELRKENLLLQRSRSLGAADAGSVPESHRLHRQQFLRHRSMFEQSVLLPGKQLTLPSEVKPILLGNNVRRSSNAVSSPKPNGLTSDKDTDLPVLKIVEDSQQTLHARVVNDKGFQAVESNTTGNTSTEKVEHVESSTRLNSQLSCGQSSQLTRHVSLEPSISELYVGKWDRPTKTVKDMKEGYLTHLTTKPGSSYHRSFLHRRSSTSAIPVKQLAQKFL